MSTTLNVNANPDDGLMIFDHLAVYRGLMAEYDKLNTQLSQIENTLVTLAGYVITAETNVNRVKLLIRDEAMKPPEQQDSSVLASLNLQFVMWSSCFTMLNKIFTDSINGSYSNSYNSVCGKLDAARKEFSALNLSPADKQKITAPPADPQLLNATSFINMAKGLE